MREFSGVVFSALSHSLRRSIVLALRDSHHQFSDLMRLCGLDPDHDSGLFVYHLSQLIDLGIVERVGEGYKLTDFGARIGELILAVERESAFLTEKMPKEEKEVKGMKEDIDVKWMGLDAMLQKGILYNTEDDFVSKMSQEQKQVYETAREWLKVDQYLVASREEKPLAYLKPDLKYLIMAECEKAPRPVKLVKSVEPQLEIEDIGVRTTESVERQNAVIALLRVLEDKGKNIGVKKIWVHKINADDNAVVSVLKERSYQRFATTYIMTKNL